MRSKDFFSATASCRSSPTKLAHVRYGPPTSPPASIYNPAGQNYSPLGREAASSSFLRTRSLRRVRSCTPVSTRRAPSRRSPRSARRIRPTASPSSRCTCFTPCSDSSAPATPCGCGRPDGSRVHHRRHRRTHHAHRRGSPARRWTLAPAVVDEPGRGQLRRGVGLRARPHRAGGTRAHVRRQSQRPQRHVLPHRVQRAGRSARGAPRTSTSTDCCAASTVSARARRRARRLSCSPRASRCRGRSKRSSCSPMTGMCLPTSGRSRPGPSFAARASTRTSRTS